MKPEFPGLIFVPTVTFGFFLVSDDVVVSSACNAPECESSGFLVGATVSTSIGNTSFCLSASEIYP